MKEATKPLGSSTISEPGPGARVNFRFSVRGTLKEIPTERHVWLAIRQGDLIWIKGDEIPANQARWSREVEEGSRRFSVVLFSVGNTGQGAVVNWFAKHRQDNNWPGLPIPSDYSQLAEVQVSER